MGKKNNRSRKSSGFAHTKKYPHERHPAHYRKKGADDIEYLTFTHSDEVILRNGESVKTIPLKSNITPSERGKRKSYVYPKVYLGKRSALGKDTNEYSIPLEDKADVDRFFRELPKEKVKFTGSKPKGKKKPRK